MKVESSPSVERPIAFSILLAEFDIETGFCLSAKYPERPRCSLDDTRGIARTSGGPVEFPTGGTCAFDLNAYDEFCAGHMLPDGAEKRTVSRTVFLVNRPLSRETERFPVYYFASAENSVKWVRNAKAANPFVAENLHCDRATGEWLISSRDGVVMDFLNPEGYGKLQIMSAFPPVVLQFVQQLKARHCVSSDAETTMTAFDTGGKELELVFVVIQASSLCHGILLQSAHLPQLMRSMSPPSKPATASQASAVVKSPLPVRADLPPLFGLSAAVTRQGTAARRGGFTKSVALLGFALSWLEPFFPLLVETALQCCDLEGKSEAMLEQRKLILRRCYDAVNGARELLRRPGRTMGSALEGDVIHLCTRSSDFTFISYTIAPFGTSHHLQIPIFSENRHRTVLRYGLDHLLEVCGPLFWTVIMAILLEKRIIILSRKGSSNDVCEAALSLGLVGNLLDPDFIAKKVFPYTSLNGYSHFCNIPGYILGTLNPIFETHYAWWDVLCDLDNRSVFVSNASATKKAVASKGLEGITKSPADSLFMKELMARLYRMTALHAPSSERHHAVLSMLEEYLHFTVIMGNSSVASGCAIPRCLRAAFVTHPAMRLRVQAHFSSTLYGMPLDEFFGGDSPQFLIGAAALRRAAQCDEAELLGTLQMLLDIVRSEREVLLFLRRLPLVFDGINPLAAQLLHPSPAVRRATTELLRRIEGVSTGNAVLASMNNFLFLVYKESCQTAAAALPHTQRGD